jgi:hypothetical protein
MVSISGTFFCTAFGEMVLVTATLGSVEPGYLGEYVKVLHAQLHCI